MAINREMFGPSADPRLQNFVASVPFPDEELVELIQTARENGFPEIKRCEEEIFHIRPDGGVEKVQEAPSFINRVLELDSIALKHSIEIPHANSQGEVLIVGKPQPLISNETTMPAVGPEVSAGE